MNKELRTGRAQPIARRDFLKLAVGVAGTSAIAASGPTPSKAPPTATPARTPAIVKWWHYPDFTQQPYAEELVKRFNESHKTIRVEPQVVGWNDYYPTLINALGAGNPPDVSRFKDYWMAEFVKAGALERLDSYVTAWKNNDVIANLWDLQRVKASDPLYMLPWQMFYTYLYYRVDWFKEAGLTPPQTIDDFLNAARKLNKPPERYGFGLRGARGGHEVWPMLTWPLGMRFVDKDGKVILDNEDGVKSNQWFLDLYMKEKVAPPSAPADGYLQIYEGFKGGKTAMVLHHLGTSKPLAEALGDKVSAVPTPSGPKGRWCNSIVDYNVMFKACKNKEAAFTFMAWITEKEQNDYWAGGTGVMPVLNSLNKKYAAINRFYKAQSESVPFAGVYPLLPTVGRWSEVTWPAVMQQALNGQIDGKTCMKQLADGMRG